MSLAILWLALVSLLGPDVAMARQVTPPYCIGSLVGSDEVFASKTMDVDQDGRSDTVIIYGKGRLFMAIISNSSAPECQVVLNAFLTGRVLKTGLQKVNVRAIELVKITGDQPPELHVALEHSGGGARVEGSFHGLYMVQDGTWREMLSFESCLAFNSFEFRDNPNGGKDIYTDEDRHCDPPVEFGRNYALLRWDGTKFASIDSGFKRNYLWSDGSAQACLILLTVVMVVMVIVVAGLFAMRGKIRRLF